MKIPIGNFGFSTPEPVDRSPITQATDRLGRIVSGIGQQQDEKAQALARAKDATAYQDHALAVDQLKADYADKVTSGDIPYETARQSFESDAAKIPLPAPTARDPAAAEALSRGTQMSIKRASLDIDQVANGARDKDLQSQGVSQLDALGKRVSLPGSDVESINAQADSVGPVLRAGGLSEAQVSRTLQNFKDTNWYNQATQVAMQSRESIPALKQLEHDLTAKDGFYAEKMDTDKRNAVLQQVISHRIQLENRLLAVGDRREARAERAANEIERQISSGVPATAEMWNDWGNTIKGTSVEPQFQELAASEREIQSALRAPIADQLRLVQQKQADLDQNGGSVAQAANVNRLANAVNTNLKTLMQTPVLFGEQRLGDKPEPIDFVDFVNPATQSQTAATLQERASRIRAMGKQFGAPVPMRPLLPQEAKDLSSAMQTGSPTEVAELFGALSDASGSPDVFKGIMQQVAPDSPVRASAGLLAQKQRELTTASHWYKPDETVTSRDVAATMLEGDRILNRSATTKTEDGKPQTKLVLPQTQLLQAEFSKQVGAAYARRPQAAEIDFQNVQAYYAGRTSQTGKIAKDSSDVDTNLVREAVRATVGNVIDYNGRGEVFAPWGMAEDDFNDRAQRAAESEAKRRGVEITDATRSLLGLRNADADGVYVVRLGKRDMLDDAGNPVLLDLRPPSASDRTGYINRTP